MYLTGKFKIIEVLGKTTAKFFTDLNVDDVLIVSLEIKNLRGASAGSYAPILSVSLEGTNQGRTISLNQFSNAMRFFTVEQYSIRKI